MTKAGYTIVWAFRIRADAQEAFEAAYGSDGDWVALFRKGEGYLESRLCRDVYDPLFFIVVDCWRSKTDYETFKIRWAEEYQALDAACEQLTIEETFLGETFLGCSGPQG